MALSANNRLSSRGAGRPRAFAVAASVHIYQGGVVNLRREAGAGAGYAKIPATNVTTTEELAGIAYGETDNSSGVAGGKTVEVHTEGEFLLSFPGETLTQADVGAKAYATSDNVLTLTATNNAYVGRITEFVSATSAFVDIKAFAV
jgi:predicted RecA/RadA family phage recombinase